jgi:hypothetical protein
MTANQQHRMSRAAVALKYFSGISHIPPTAFGGSCYLGVAKTNKTRIDVCTNE